MILSILSPVIVINPDSHKGIPWSAIGPQQSCDMLFLQGKGTMDTFWLIGRNDMSQANDSMVCKFKPRGGKKKKKPKKDKVAASSVSVKSGIVGKDEAPVTEKEGQKSGKNLIVPGADDISTEKTEKETKKGTPDDVRKDDKEEKSMKMENKSEREVETGVKDAPGGKNGENSDVRNKDHPPQTDVSMKSPLVETNIPKEDKTQTKHVEISRSNEVGDKETESEKSTIIDMKTSPDKREVREEPSLTPLPNGTASDTVLDIDKHHHSNTDHVIHPERRGTMETRRADTHIVLPHAVGGQVELPIMTKPSLPAHVTIVIDTGDNTET